jgi:hypothetical protein
VAFEKICKLASNVNPTAMFPDNHPAIARVMATINSKDYFDCADQPLHAPSAEAAVSPSPNPAAMDLGGIAN